MSSRVPARTSPNKSPHVRPRPRPRPSPRRRSIGSPPPCPDCCGDTFYDVSSDGAHLVCFTCEAVAAFYSSPTA